MAPRAQTPDAAERDAVVHPDDLPSVRETRARLAVSTEAIAHEFRVTLPDGVRWLASRSIAVIDEQGRPRRRIGVNGDITDAKTADWRTATAKPRSANNAPAHSSWPA
jgi:PAS domain-containing protein